MSKIILCFTIFLAILISPAMASEVISDYEAITKLVTWERQSRVTTNRWVKVNGEEAVLTSYMRLLYSVECREGV